MTTSKIKEDVPSTVAGFYYQALLACKEITSLANSDEPETTLIGIERGADVKISRSGGTEISIEAKFYGKNFNENSSAITHSIYNFYKNSFNDTKLVFVTNVKVDDSDEIKFSLNNWSLINDDEIELYRRYLHRCLILESAKKNKSEQRTRFLNYQKQNNINGNSKNIEACGEIVNDGSLNIQDYIDITLHSEEDERKFLRKMVFRFSTDGNVAKVRTILELKKDIKNNIIISNNNKDVILNVLLDSFLQTTVEPTKNEYQGFKREAISVKDYNKICSNAQESDMKLINDSRVKDIIQKINADEEKFILALKLNYTEAVNSKQTELIASYCYFRNLFMQELSCSDNLEELNVKYSIMGDDSAFQYVKLMRNLAILASFKNVDIQLIPKEDGDGLANLKIGFNNAFCYKYSGRIEYFSDFLYFFISETKESVQQITTPIVADCSFKDNAFPCKFNRDIKTICDIGSPGLTDKFITYYRNLDYRCTNCISYSGSNNDIMKLLDKFFDCENIKLEENV